MEILILNKKVRLNYETLETYEAGIELLGFEVKALRQKKGELAAAHVSVRGGEAYLIGVTIPPYQPSNTPKGYEPDRNRRLLLSKKEIAALSGAEDKKGLTIVPILMYNKGRKIKVQIAVVRGKKKFDKRQTIKKRETERDMRRTLKNQ